MIFLWTYVFLFNHPKGEILRPDFEKHNFKTGDIILFHALDNINPLLIATYYTHIGIVYKRGDELLLFEAVNPTTEILLEENSNGIVLCDLEKRLRCYRGYLLYKELDSEVPQSTQDNFEIFIKYLKENCYYNTGVFRNFVNKVIFGENIHRGLNCGELVYLSLIALGILPKKYFDENRKHHIKWLSALEDTGNGYYYSDVKYIYFDPFDQT